jgi:hypothetical protein
MIKNSNCAIIKDRGCQLNHQNQMSPATGPTRPEPLAPTTDGSAT